MFFPECMSWSHMSTWYPRRPGGGIRSPEATSTGGCEPPYECRESNTNPLEEQSMLLDTKRRSDQFIENTYPSDDPGETRSYKAQEIIMCFTDKHGKSSMTPIERHCLKSMNLGKNMKSCVKYA